MKTAVASVLVAAAFCSAALAQGPGSWPEASTPGVLPRPDFHFPGNVGRTILDSDPPQFPQPVQAPEGAPNVVLILLDDAGFGQFATFGGGIASPTMDALAAEGLRFTRFHTTALCSPTRAALITGRNHHSAATGVIAEAATGYDGYTSILPRSAGTDRRGAAAERLHDRLDRQEPQHAGLGDQRRRAVRPLGQRPRLRLFLRLQRRRHEPLQPGALREPQPGAGLDRSGLLSDHRHRRPRHRLGAQGQEHRAGPAVFPLRRARRHPLAAPGAEGVDRASSRASSTPAGTPTARRRSRGRRSSASCPRTPTSRSAPRACPPGTR